MEGGKLALGEHEEGIKKVKAIVESETRWRKKECVNLIASENVTSQLVDSVYHSDFSHRYAEGDPGKRFYNGVKYADEAEIYAVELAKRVFHAKQANLQPISGTVANFAALAMFTRPCDTIIVNSTANGGHISHNDRGAAGLLSTYPVFWPTTEDGFHMDVDKAVKLVESKANNVRAHLTTVILGKSLFLFPEPVKEIAAAAHANGVKVIYDGAHVLGLIAGKRFQEPLRDGADVVTASTHKTLFGPQGGIILSDMDDEAFARYKGCVFPGVVSNHHLHRLPALAIAFHEHLAFGHDYAKQVIANAKALGAALSEEGFDVKCEEFGFTESHQIAFDASEFGGGKLAGDALEHNNVIVNKNLLPGEKITQASLNNPGGVRVGVQEMTRWGAVESDMREIAVVFAKVLKQKKDAKKDAEAMRARLHEVKYTF